MGKGTDLWDDSALINAFDHAMATYKEMHSNNNHGNFAKKGKQTNDGDDHNIILIEKTVGNLEPGSNSDNSSSDTAEAHAPFDNNKMVSEDFSSQGITFGADVHALEPELHSAGFPCTDEKTQSSSDQQYIDCDQLLRQYNDLEEQRQKVVQQLHQANYWNQQTPIQSSVYQLPQASEYSTSEHSLQAPCSMCSCHCVAVALVPGSACALGGLSSGCYSCYPSHMTSCLGSQAPEVAGIHFPAADGLCSTAATMNVMDPVNNLGAVDNGIKVGMLAVERAINSLKMEISESSNDSKETKEDISSDTLEGKGSQSISLETDLSAVLNAWYLAGFHTGRYLSEQSRKNARR